MSPGSKNLGYPEEKKPLLKTHAPKTKGGFQSKKKKKKKKKKKEVTWSRRDLGITLAQRTTRELMRSPKGRTKVDVKLPGKATIESPKKGLLGRLSRKETGGIGSAEEARGGTRKHPK